jgi:hypothetical protein
VANIGSARKRPQLRQLGEVDVGPPHLCATDGRPPAAVTFSISESVITVPSRSFANAASFSTAAVIRDLRNAACFRGCDPGPQNRVGRPLVCYSDVPRGFASPVLCGTKRWGWDERGPRGSCRVLSSMPVRGWRGLWLSHVSVSCSEPARSATCRLGRQPSRPALRRPAIATHPDAEVR